MRRHVVVCFLLALLVPGTVRADAPEREPIEVKEVRDAHGHAGVLFTFPRRSPPHPAPLTLKDARLLLAAFDEVYGRQGPLPPVAFPGASEGLRLRVVGGTEWQRRVRGDCLEFYGPGRASLMPGDVLSSPFIRALLLSPKYMAEGVRGAAVELFSSPTFMASMGLSLVLYMAALVAPEPFLTKGAVAALTLYLMWTYGATEVLNVAEAVVRLYEESREARTPGELEEAAKHFGVKIGGVGLRVGVVVALAEVAGRLPAVPREPGGGGLWARLGMPEGALMRSVTWEGVPVAQTSVSGTAVVVEETAVAEVSVRSGTFLLMGALLGAEDSAIAAASKALRTTGGCREDNRQGDAPEHHIATNKNSAAEVRGGPWTPRFEKFFHQADIDMEHPANRIFVIGHKGPHPEAYHEEVYSRLWRVLAKCKNAQDCKEQLLKALDEIADDICKSGSKLNKLVTKSP